MATIEHRLHTTMKALRAQRGFTQAHLAELSAITRKSINEIENCRMVPSTVLALRLAHALGVTVEQLFQLDEGAAPAA
jgi:putative transcriptional regulator